MSNETDIIKVLAPYLAAFPQSRMDRSGLIIYARALKELSVAEINAAMLHLMRTMKFFPSVAEIFEAADTIRGAAKSSGLPDAGEAWREAIACVQKYSVYKEWQYSCDAVKQACKRFGVRDLCELETDNVNTARAQFMRIYNEIVSTAKRRREVSGTMQALGSGNVAALISGLAAEKDMNREVDQDVHERSAV